MKNLLVALSIIPLLSCGIKKELEQANHNNRVLKEKVEILESKNTIKERELNNCKNSNSTLTRENKELTYKLKTLQKGDNTIEEETSEVFTIVEEMPEFPGGNDKLMTYISKRIQYPDLARENNIQGRVFVEFVINKDGSVSNTKVLRGIGGGCDQEALKAVNSLPKWKPGTQRGKPVRTRYVLPISFNLR